MRKVEILFAGEWKKAKGFIIRDGLLTGCLQWRTKDGSHGIAKNEQWREYQEKEKKP